MRKRERNLVFEDPSDLKEVEGIESKIEFVVLIGAVAVPDRVLGGWSSDGYVGLGIGDVFGRGGGLEADGAVANAEGCEGSIGSGGVG